MSGTVRFISKTGNQQASELLVFAHGYLAAPDQSACQRLLEQLPAPAPDSETLLANWDSGSLQQMLGQTLKGAALGFAGFGKLALARSAFHAVKGGYEHFSTAKARTRQLGAVFLSELAVFASHYPNLQRINLYGHSLGARLLIEALLTAEHSAQQLPLQDLILLGCARELNPTELELLLPQLQGRILNFYSRSDRILQARPSRGKWLGRHPLPEESAPERLINIRLDIGHSDYWKLLDPICQHAQQKNRQPDSQLLNAIDALQDKHRPDLKQLPERLRQLKPGNRASSG